MDTGMGEKEIPLIEEIQAINKYFKKAAIIIIDDLRLFGCGPELSGDKYHDVDWSYIKEEDVVLKEGVVIQNGAVIGADGFGYLPDPEKGLIPVPQVGNVTLCRAVEIGANTCIDRATLGTTFIDMGSKIDNLVQIGHNTKVGKHTIICGQSAIAGSSKIGNQVVLGGNVGVADHTEVADGCRFGAFSGLHGKYEIKGDYAGNPAMPASTYRRVVTLIPKLPELFKKLKN
jgi:UDP-3-O-[3-hydroxymyristoyl] glucosamine N-acyltransferase